MSLNPQEELDAGLILAAEECPPDRFSELHLFTNYDDVIIRKLTAHGPVLIRGGRGSGKSAFLIEATRRMRSMASIFPVYMSLRYLPLLQSDGDEYISIFSKLLSEEINRELRARGLQATFEANDELSMQLALNKLGQYLNSRIVILFDDAAHIGREKPLEVFFDLFRTLSSGTVSCKASIYPGVTKFGVRFDVFNDSTVIDISRSDASFGGYFFNVMKLRYPQLTLKENFSDRLSPEKFANLLGRAVVGNMRAFILTCNRFEEHVRVNIPNVNACLLNMATDYYWPLMEEVAPKLGVYEPLIEPATTLFQAVIDHVCKPVVLGLRIIAPDRVIVHRQLVSQFGKMFEILEYLGFFAKQEASRGMKSGGRGPVYALNLCSILDQMPTKRLTIEIIDEWIEAKQEPSEIHSAGLALSSVVVPVLGHEHGLGILEKDISVLSKSRAYPYGLTEDKVSRLRSVGITTVRQLASTSDDTLQRIDWVGPATVKRIRDVIHQAVWM